MAPDKKADNKDIFVLNGTQFFEEFHRNLCNTLEMLGCRIVVASGWEKAKKILGNSPKRFDLFILDPSVEDFHTDEIGRWIESAKKYKESGVITIQLFPDFEPSAVDRDLRTNACIAKSYSMQEIAFVLNRFLFPHSSNKRRFPRALASLDIEAYDLSNKRNAVNQETFNLSAGGLFIKSFTPFPRESKVALKLYLPDGGIPLKLNGCVRFSRQYTMGEISLSPSGMGIELEEITSDITDRLSGYVSHRLLVTEPEFRRENAGTPDATNTEKESTTKTKDE